MKRILLSVFAIILCLNVFGQRKVDFVVTVPDPTPGQFIQTGVPFNVTIHFLNNGPDSIKRGDSLLLEVLAGGSTVLYSAKTSFATKFPKGDTASITVKNISVTISQPGASTICGIAIVKNKTSDSLRDISDSNGECVPVALTGIQNPAFLNDKVEVYPNPANKSTTFSYQTLTPGQVNLSLYDITGKLVTTVVNEYETPGKFEYNVNTENLKAGLYIYKLSTGDDAISGKLIIAN